MIRVAPWNHIDSPSAPRTTTPTHGPTARVGRNSQATAVATTTRTTSEFGSADPESGRALQRRPGFATCDEAGSCPVRFHFAGVVARAAAFDDAQTHVLGAGHFEQD